VNDSHQHAVRLMFFGRGPLCCKQRWGSKVSVMSGIGCKNVISRGHTEAVKCIEWD